MESSSPRRTISESFSNVFRRRPTASARRVKQLQLNNEGDTQLDDNTNVENTTDDTNVDNTNDKTEADDNTEGGEELTCPFPSGPTDPTILRSFITHVAASIWVGEERDVLRCHCLTAKLLNWKHINEPSSRTWRSLIKRSGLMGLSRLSYKGPDRNLITAFVERWHPETNSFHLPFGEMTITLDDVHCLTGLNVTGRALQCLGDTDSETGVVTIKRLLGVSVTEANNAVIDKSGSSVKLNWLFNKFVDSTCSDDESTALYAARAFLLYTLGYTLFTDKSGDRVSTSYLSLFVDLEESRDYAWGAATLAFMYRQLGLTSRMGVKQIAGYLTLLEAWIYEHFPTIVRPEPNGEYISGGPLAMRWAQQTHVAGSENAVKAYKDILDSLRAEDVVWDPYQTYRDSIDRPEVVFYEGCIRVGDIVEPYMPDRVLRQFRYVQTIPQAPLRPNSVRRGKKAGQYKLTWGFMDAFFDEWNSHKLDVQRRGTVAYPLWQCIPEYMDWFKRISHPRVQNPQHSIEFYVTQCVHFPSPWEGIQTAIDRLESVRTMWRNRDESLTMEYAMTQVEDAYQSLYL